VKRDPLGIFDSGVGGLSVLRAVQQSYPDEDLIYLADQAHVPYGPRSLEEVRAFAEGITRYLLDQDAKLIVVACNTASAAALHYLRQTFPEVPFVGMEPAVKPAAEHTKSGVVGVLATTATFQGALYASVIERFANGVTVLQDACPGLVNEIEAGNLDSRQTQAIIEAALNPMLAQGIDTVVLGCTHYPFVIPTIQRIAGPRVRVIDPAPAIARQVGRLLDQHSLHAPEGQSGRVRFLTSGARERFQSLILQLLGTSVRAESVQWTAGRPPSSAGALTAKRRPSSSKIRGIDPDLQ
jgi:glutamate racemase